MIELRELIDIETPADITYFPPAATGPLSPPGVGIQEAGDEMEVDVTAHDPGAKPPLPPRINYSNKYR